MKKTKDAKVFVFKVALKGARSIWRRIAIRSDQTLDDLHEAIFDAFDRYDEHLYSFYVPPVESRGRARLRDATVFTHPYAAEDPGPFADERIKNAAKTKIEDLKLVKGQRFNYLFDFGDNWWHELTVEQTDGEPSADEYPQITEVRGEPPPQYPELDEDDE
jgi:hypothetical protein